MTLSYPNVQRKVIAKFVPVAAKEAVQDVNGDGNDRGQCDSHGPDAADSLPCLVRLPAISGMFLNGVGSYLSYEKL